MKRLLSLLISAILISTIFISCSSISISESEKKYTNSESKFLEVDGMRIHYRMEGNGPVIILLHGMLSSLHTWEPWTKKLSKNYTVISLDLPGFGLTGPAPELYPYNIESSVKFLDNVFNKLKLTKFTLAGNSLGGYFSWNYAIKYPEKVEKLVLIDSVAYANPVPLPITMMTMPILGSASTKITPKFAVNYFISQVYGDKSKLTDKIKDRYYELLMREGNRDACKIILEEIKRQSTNQHVGDDLALLNNKLPILVMWGKMDPWLPVTILDTWKKNLPSAKYVVFENEGHIPMEELPGVTADTLINFMQSSGTADKTIISKSER